MKKIIALISFFVVMALMVSGCGAPKTSSTEPASSNEQQAAKVKLGIIQIVEHPALDSSRKGFLDVLTENGYKEGQNLEVNYQNAQGDQSNLQTIAQKFVSDKEDLVLAIATPSAISMASETKDIPILITAVTDPVAAKLVKNNDKPETNVTGTTDAAPLQEQLELVKKFKPDAKKIGIIYNSSEVNSEVQVDAAKKIAPEMGFEIVEATVTGSAEVMQAAQSLVGKVDAIYIPTDNVVASSIASVVSIAEKNKLPLIAAEAGMVEGGALATVGIDYYKLGRQTGEMALKVIKGEKPEGMAIESQKDFNIIINKGAAQRMGVEIPQDLLAKASKVIE